MIKNIRDLKVGDIVTVIGHTGQNSLAKVAKKYVPIGTKLIVHEILKDCNLKETVDTCISCPIDYMNIVLHDLDDSLIHDYMCFCILGDESGKPLTINSLIKGAG